MTTTTVTITGKSWDEERVGEVEGPHAVARATFTTEWKGEISGTSTCWLLLTYVDGDPDKPRDAGRPVRRLRTGRRRRSATAAAPSSWPRRATTAAAWRRPRSPIVAGSGTGGLDGIRGSGSYAADAMEYSLELDYELG